VDGAGTWHRFRHITLPQLKATLLFVAMVTTILAFRLFDQVWVLTQGGPKDATATLLYQGYVAARERNQIGLGCAISAVLCVLVGMTALAFHAAIRKGQAKP
jgi:multiple sugar transport system permease protein